MTTPGTSGISENVSQYFSSDYAQARERFLTLAKSPGIGLDHYQVDGNGPNGIPLYTDFAWIGTKTPRKILVVQSGVHGVEAFAGAAIQCHLLDDAPTVPGDCALVLVHILNPFGMAWLRRVNASNVDLNRNCLPAGREYSGVAKEYAMLNKLINPSSPPAKDLFLLRVLYAVLRHGFAPLKQAIALGQYEYPSGLFYGGAKLEQEPQRYRKWLRQHIHGPEKLWVVDLHTGLGRFGQCQLFPALTVNQRTLEALRVSLGDTMATDKFQAGAYDIIGGVADLFKEMFASAQPVYLTAEFGTYPALRVLHALREENRCHFYVAHDHGHPAKQRLKEALCPSADSWRSRVLRQGRTMIDKLLAHMAGS